MNFYPRREEKRREPRKKKGVEGVVERWRKKGKENGEEIRWERKAEERMMGFLRVGMRLGERQNSIQDG